MFINDTTHYTRVYLLAHKNNMPHTFQHFVTIMLHNHQCHWLHSNRGGEYTSMHFQHILKEHGITHLPTAAYTPEHNRVAKQYNHMVMTMVHSLLQESGLGEEYWGEALHMAILINNRIPPNAKMLPPYKQWHGKAPRINHC
jgi:hypothetical protein